MIRQPASSLWHLSMLLAALTLVSGCRGCSSSGSDPEAEVKDKKDPTKTVKPDFEPLKVAVVPQRAEVAVHPVKPGHWTAAVSKTKANNYDFVGQLHAEVRPQAMGAAADLERTPHRLAVSRSAALPKGQEKFFESYFFVPSNLEKAWLVTELLNRGGGASTAAPAAEPLSLAGAHQYFIVVLAADADRYRRLERLDSVRAPHGSGPLNYYHVITPPLEKPLPLPSNALAWTSIAYLIWDDADPTLLTVEQQQALVDWLHWGGQLIVSGPKSLDQLRLDTFLAPYLPATPGEPIKISADTLAPLNHRWTLPQRGQPGPPLSPVTPWSGLALTPQPQARFLPDTGKLIIERPVGRGRIVATAFRLTERALWNWPGFDGLLNACLLRRPPRVFAPTPDPSRVSVDWADGSGRVLDPGRVTALRYLCRDWSQQSGFNAEPPKPAQTATDGTAALTPSTYSRFTAQPITDELDLSEAKNIGPGVAAWNDFSDVASGSRETLKQAAGIVIPQAQFVVWVLLLYLVVLVPLNWLVFWALGHLEWAWIAAPLIAIGAMVSVVRLAQLDIGFARSQTEVAVLETYAGYPRGHLARFTALYTSLSSQYELEADDPNTVALPLAIDATFQPLPGQAMSTVVYHPSPGVELTDVPVSSNSTAMLHTEQMFDLGGAIEYSSRANGTEIYNRTTLHLKRAALVRRTANGEYQIGWIGELTPGRGTKITFLRPEALQAIVPDWSFKLATSSTGDGPMLDFDPLANSLRDPPRLRPGETRLLALIEEPLPGIKIDPAPSQSPRGGTLLVAHLEQPPLPDPRPDQNTRRDILGDQPEREPELDSGFEDPLLPTP